MASSTARSSRVLVDGERLSSRIAGVALYEPVRFRRRVGEEAEGGELEGERELRGRVAGGGVARRRKRSGLRGGFSQPLPGEQSVPTQRIELGHAAVEGSRRIRLARARLPVEAL